MSKMKVHEYAKQIGRPARELVLILQEQGVDVKSHLSNIDDNGIKIINKKLGISDSDAQKVLESKTRIGFRVGKRPSSARSLGTAASIKKEVEKEEKAKERAQKKEQSKKEENDIQKKDTKVLNNENVSVSEKSNSLDNEKVEKAKEKIIAEKQKNKKSELNDNVAHEEKKVGKIEGSVEAKDQNVNQQNGQKKNKSEDSNQMVKKQENVSKDNGVLKNNQINNNVKQGNDNMQSNSIEKKVNNNNNNRNNDEKRNNKRNNHNNGDEKRNNDGNRNSDEKRNNRNNNNNNNKNNNKNNNNKNNNGDEKRNNRNNNNNNKNNNNKNNNNDEKRNNRNGNGNNRNRNNNGDEKRNNRNNRNNNSGSNNNNNNRNNDEKRNNRNTRNNDNNNRYNNKNDNNNRNGGNNRNNDRNRNDGGNQQNRGRYNDRGGNNRNNDKSSMVSTSFVAASKSSLEVGRSGRANWSNRKNNNEDYRYDDDLKENFEGLSKANAKKNKKKNEKPKKGAFIKPEPVVVEEPDDGIKNIILPEVLTIKELADKVKVQPAALVKKLFLEGKVVTINQEITFEEAEEIALEYNCIAELEEKVDLVAEILKEEEEDEALLEKRAPVVCVMGHVDHGKTSLLDAIRETNVTAKEAGGITQHIGASVIDVNGESITFLDTPGHEAFTAMRMRGANSTDIAILVVAADDGVMPQTVEAINHAKAAEIQVIVAVNKIDKPSANVERVKQELVEHELVAEDWGGDTIFVPVSAHTHEGIDQLLEMILLTAEMAELKANPNREARGLVIEAELDKGRGPVATVLVQKGTLKVGETVAVGSVHGKVRAMIDDKGRRIKQAGPSTPVEILGLNGVPNAGEILLATENEKEARNIAETFIKQGREKLLEDTKMKLSLDGLFSQIKAGNIKELNIIVKADVQGSVEAVKQSLLKLSNEEVAVRIIHGGVGAINESDVSLASASNAIIIGFNVRPDNLAREIAEREKVDLRLYKVIYNAIEDVAAAMKGMLDPIYEEKVIGHAEIRQLYKASGVGTIAGSYVLDGKIVRGSKVRITREGEQIFEGNLASLKRFKDDVKEVATGYDCGLLFEKFNDIQELDLVEIYIMQEVPR